MKDDLETQLAVKRGIVSEKKIDKLDITTTIEFIKYYFSHMRRVWVDASLEGKLAIGCSMFPDGLIFENKDFRTPQLGRGYAMTREYSTPSVPSGEPEFAYFEHLIEEYTAIYRHLRGYVTFPTIQPLTSNNLL